MNGPMNELGQPIGAPVPDWTRRPRPPRAEMTGRFCRVVPLDPERHAADLYAANLEDRDGRGWTYLPYGPFHSLEEYRQWMVATCLGDDPLFHAIIDPRSGRAVGVAGLMRIEPAAGVIEIGHIRYSPALQGSPAATEAMVLLMRRVFEDLGYRRYEWKCDALNAPSRAAAQRLGFRYEGVFRQAAIYKGRSRDTAWFSVIDREWPTLSKPAAPLRACNGAAGRNCI